MKLLFDQNISYRILNLLKDIFPDSVQVKQLGLENSRDMEIYEYAGFNDYTIVTFDSDFFDINTLKGFPSKIIWIRTGNTTTQNLASILRDNYKTIKIFSEEDYGCLEIFG